MTWRQRMIYREGGAGIDVLGRRPIGWHTLEYGSLESLIPHEWPWNVHVPETGCGWSAQLVYSPSPPLCKLRSHGAKMLPGIHVHGGRGGGWRALTAAYASVKRFNHQSSRHPSTEPASLLRISYRITCRVQPGSCCACCVHWGISTVHRTYGTVVPSALQPGRRWVSNTLSIPQSRQPQADVKRLRRIGGRAAGRVMKHVAWPGGKGDGVVALFLGGRDLIHAQPQPSLLWGVSTAALGQARPASHPCHDLTVYSVLVPARSGGCVLSAARRMLWRPVCARTGRVASRCGRRLAARSFCC